MYCRNCGTNIPDNAMFCTSCGTPIKKAESSENNAVPPQPVFPPSNDEIPKKSKKKIYISVAAASVVIIAAISCLLAFGHVFEKSAPAATTTEPEASLAQKNCVESLLSSTKKTLLCSGTDFDVDITEDGNSYSGSGFISFGKDLSDSVGYFEMDIENKGYESIFEYSACISNGFIAYIDGSFYDYYEVSKILPEFFGSEFQAENLVKGNKLNEDALKQYYSLVSNEFATRENIKLPAYEDAYELIEKFILNECDKEELTDSFVSSYDEQDTADGTEYSFDLDVEELLNAFLTYVEEDYPAVMDVMDNLGMDKAELLEEAEEFGDIGLKFTVSKGYLTYLEVIFDDENKLAVSLSNINNPTVEMDKVNDLVTKAKKNYSGY